MQNSWFPIVWESHQNCSMGPFDGALPGSWQDSHRQRMEYRVEYIDYIITMGDPTPDRNAAVNLSLM